MCTGVQMTSTTNKNYWGRTQEFDMFLPIYAFTAPAGVTSKYLESKFTSKNALVGISFDGAPLAYDYLVMADGVNEKGLAGGSFALNNHYAKTMPHDDIIENGKMPLRGEEFVTWALMTCDSCEDLEKKALTDVAISDTPNVQGQVLGQHFVFVDRTGKSIVIEPIVSGSFKIYDNPVGTFTNQPAFPWHLQNLQNYVGVTNQMTPDKSFKEYLAFSTGKGSGLRGVPGDSTPQSRFIRAAVLNALSDVPEDEEAMGAIFHILNNFDIPKGVVKSKHPLSEKELNQYTQYTSVFDLENLVMQLSTFENRQVQELKLDLENIGTDVRRYKILHEERIYSMELEKID